eukprot:TRINITY_DN3773_c0_g1_i4.p1 TRINITY_DN3773_c0_g1~~TRINITY_DN3773_c0_g1_i4.p1  ORF type:complete len:146 (-),score=39.42 TRINITY_DN3773_c0_g1_i4:36-473(-)
MSPNIVKLFDLRTFEKGPFDDFYIEGVNASWSGAKFSNSGLQILLSTHSDDIIVLDAYDGILKHRLSRPNGFGQALEASYTPDDKFILGGGDDGAVYVWSSETGDYVDKWEGHAGPVRCAKWNPVYGMGMSACTNVGMWIPTDEE